MEGIDKRGYLSILLLSTKWAYLCKQQIHHMKVHLTSWSVHKIAQTQTSQKTCSSGFHYVCIYPSLFILFVFAVVVIVVVFFIVVCLVLVVFLGSPIQHVRNAISANLSLNKKQANLNLLYF